MLFIAVQNLVANAVEFSAPGDTVEVRPSEDGDALLLEVADTGAGIPAEHAASMSVAACSAGVTTASSPATSAPAPPKRVGGRGCVEPG